MCCWISGSRGDESWVETECRYIKRRWNLDRKVEIGIVWTKLVSFVDISSASFFFENLAVDESRVMSNLFPSSRCDQDRLGLGYSASECAFFHKRWRCRSLGVRFAGFRWIFMDVSLSIDLPPKIWLNLLFICFWQILLSNKELPLAQFIFKKSLWFVKYRKGSHTLFVLSIHQFGFTFFTHPIWTKTYGVAKWPAQVQDIDLHWCLGICSRGREMDARKGGSKNIGAFATWHLRLRLRSVQKLFYDSNMLEVCKYPVSCVWLGTSYLRVDK